MSQAMDEMIKSRMMLLKSRPFWGILLCQLELNELELDHPCQTMATDGRRLFFNPLFSIAIGPECRETIMEHEIGHIMLKSFKRRGSRDPRIWNFATDYAINGMLVDSGRRMLSREQLDLAMSEVRAGRPAPRIVLGKGHSDPIWLYDKKYYGLTAETIYDVLVSDLESGDLSESELGSLDDHTMWDDEISKETADRWKQSINSAAARNAGSIPGSISRMIRDLNDPRVDWRQILPNQLSSLSSSDYQWIPPSQTFFGMGITVPDLTLGETVNIGFAADTSGSIDETDLRDALSELHGIGASYNQYRIEAISFDYVVQSNSILSSDDPFMEFEPKGGGGTRFSPIFEHFSDRDVDALVIFTDGMAEEDWGMSKYHGNPKMVIWLVINERVAPFGITIRYEKSV